MTEDKKARLIDRIRKLLALAGSPNENEAMAAAEKVQALLAEHNLDMDDVEKAAESKLGLNALKMAAAPWKRIIANAVAHLYFSEYVLTQKGKTSSKGWQYWDDVHLFVGEEHNVNVAIMMFLYLTAATERLSKEGAKAVPLSQRTRYNTSFRFACATRLAVRINAKLAEARAAGLNRHPLDGKNLPALADLYDKTSRELTLFIAEEMGDTETKKTKAPINDIKGALDGHAAGDKIGLDKQVSGRGSAHLLSK